jgi:hypothetical protein
MASTQTWSEFNSVTGTCTESASIGYMNWMNADLPDTTGIIYQSYPITAGNSSYTKYQALKFGGTYDNLSAFTYSVSTTTPSANVTLNGSVVTSWVAPVATANTESGSLASAVSAGFGTGTFTAATSPTTGPFSTSGGSSTSTNPIYANALRTQIQTTSSAAPGDFGTVTITAAWTES